MKKYIVADRRRKTYITFDVMTMDEAYKKFGKPIPEWVTVCADSVEAIGLMLERIKQKRFNIDKTCESLRIASEKL